MYENIHVNPFSQTISLCNNDCYSSTPFADERGMRQSNRAGLSTDTKCQQSNFLKGVGE